MFTISSLQAREVLDSRGNPTVEAEIRFTNGSYGHAIVPSGASTGSHEALELRDNDPSRYLGKGVLQAVNNINKEIAQAVIGRDFSDFRVFDRFLIDLDGTENKSRLGANAILAVSMAFVCASARSNGLELYDFLGKSNTVPATDFMQPMPLMNIINGGAHADNPLDIQECMIVPVGGTTIVERVRMGAEVFHHLKKILSRRGLATSVGDE